MSRTNPDLLVSYELPIPKGAVQPFIDTVGAPGLLLAVKTRPSSGPLAGVQWLLPTAVIIWFGKSYFEAFLKEAGKEHYVLVKRGLSSLWSLFFGESRSVRSIAVGTSGKIPPDGVTYSLSISILAEGHSGLRFKLLFRDDISAEAFNAATANFLHFLEKYYAGELDAVTEVRLGTARAVAKTILFEYDPDQGFFTFLDPIPNQSPGESDSKRG